MDALAQVIRDNFGHAKGRGLAKPIYVGLSDSLPGGIWLNHKDAMNAINPKTIDPTHHPINRKDISLNPKPHKP